MGAQVKKLGFTLIELLIGTMVSTVLLMIISLILIMPARSNQINKEYADVSREVTYAMRVMAMDIRCAPYSDIAANYGVNKLVLPERDGEFNDVWTDTVDYQADSVSGKLIRYVNGSQIDVLISQGLTRFSTSLPNDGSRGVVVRYSINRGNGDVAIEHETFIHARN